ncbi:hypothetical protein ACL9RI_25380 [Janthinobacterium sp. Mn2066]
MTGVDWNTVVPVLLSSGVLVQGLAAVRWVVKLEARVAALEGRV